MVDIARANGISVVIASILPAAKIPVEAGDWPRPKQVVDAECLAARSRAVDAARSTPITTARWRTPRAGMSPDVAPDGIHPNARGHATDGADHPRGDCRSGKAGDPQGALAPARIWHKCRHRSAAEAPERPTDKAAMKTQRDEAPMIELLTAPTPNGWKISIMLEECGLPYRVQWIDLGKGEQFAPDFLTISPNNRIPAITDHAPADGGEPISVFETGTLLDLAEKTGQFLPMTFAAASG